jgi:hypothetical protein
MSFPTPPEGGFHEDQVIWLFGHPRSGTTWLARLLTDGFGLKMWNEPYLVQVLGFANRLQRNEPGRFADETFWMSDPQQDNWRASLNVFLTDVIARQGGAVGDHPGLVIKEPNGSPFAPTLLKAMPEARVIFMLRDPRDVIASLIDARKPGSWMDQRVTGDFDRGAIVNSSVRRFLRIADVLDELAEIATDRLYEVRYETLRADTTGELERLAVALRVPFDAERLATAVERHAYEAIPEDRKGPGKFVRTARVGGWRDELKAGEIRRINNKLAAFLTAKGYSIEPEQP